MTALVKRGVCGIALFYSSLEAATAEDGPAAGDGAAGNHPAGDSNSTLATAAAAASSHPAGTGHSGPARTATSDCSGRNQA